MSGHFDLTRLPQPRRDQVATAIAACDYPFERLRDSYAKSQGIPADGANIIVQLEDLAPSNGAAWHDQGYIGISNSLPDNFKVESYVVHELGHAVDALAMTAGERLMVRVVLHDGRLDSHDWLHEEGHDHAETDYSKQVGEAFASLFVLAYSPYRIDLPGAVVNFPAHAATLDRARLVRAYMTPDLPTAPWLDPVRRARLVEVWEDRDGNGREKLLGALGADLSVKIGRAKAAGHKVKLRS